MATMILFWNIEYIPYSYLSKLVRNFAGCGCWKTCKIK